MFSTVFSLLATVSVSCDSEKTNVLRGSCKLVTSYYFVNFNF